MLLPSVDVHNNVAHKKIKYPDPFEFVHKHSSATQQLHNTTPALQSSTVQEQKKSLYSLVQSSPTKSLRSSIKRRTRLF